MNELKYISALRALEWFKAALWDLTGKLVVITRKRKILKCSFLGISECKLHLPQLFQVPELVKYTVGAFRIQHRVQ